MIATIHLDAAGLILAFGAGMVSFLSPCVLPLVPGYVSMITGVGSNGRAAGRDRRSLLIALALFVGGFTLVFTALGAAASTIGSTLRAHETVLSTVSGYVVIFCGVVLIVSALPDRALTNLSPRLRAGAARILAERRVNVRPSTFGAWAPPLTGMAFAFAWTPCIGPILASVLALGASRTSLPSAVVLLIVYSLGLGVPFVVTGLAAAGASARWRRGVTTLHLVGGVILVAFGVLVVTHQLSWVSSWASRLMSDIGLGRLTRGA